MHHFSNNTHIKWGGGYDAVRYSSALCIFEKMQLGLPHRSPALLHHSYTAGVRFNAASEGMGTQPTGLARQPTVSVRKSPIVVVCEHVQAQRDGFPYVRYTTHTSATDTHNSYMEGLRSSQLQDVGHVQEE